jgi:putative ABC transport system permease protein
LGRTLLTVLGVALGVAVLVAIDLANESAVASFKQTVSEVAGEAQLTVRGNAVGLPGETVRRLGADPSVETAEPLISVSIRLLGDDRVSTRTLLLMGTDFLRSENRSGRAVRDLRFETTREGTSFLVDDSVLIVPRLFLDRTGLSPGDKARFEFAGRVREMELAGVIESGRFAEALDGNLAVCEIGMADLLLNRQGLIDRVDLVLREGEDVDQVAARLASELPGSVIIERPETRGRQADEMLAAFRFNLRALGHISILVGAFLIYNAMSVAVVRRRPVIGTLRAMGVRAATVRAVFLSEGLVIGLLGCLVGIPMGIGMALLMLDSVSAAISINFIQTNATRLAAAPEILLTAAGIGILGAVAAAVRPAQEAAATPPANTMRAGSEERAPSLVSRHLLPGSVLALLGVLLLGRETGTGLPIIGYTATVLLVGAFVFWSRPAIKLATIVARRGFLKLFGAEGLLATSSLAAATGRASVAVCGLMISLGMTISVTVMVSSFRVTVVDWMEQVLLADLYITPYVEDATARPEPMQAVLAESIAKIPGVVAVDPFRTRTFTLNGRTANLGAGDLAAARFGNRVKDGRPAKEAMLLARERGEVVISEAFARKHSLGRGDSVSIPTPAGPVEFVVSAVYTDFSSEQGYVIMDRLLYLQHFADPLIDSIAVYLAQDADRALIRREIDQVFAAADGAPAVIVRANTDLRTFALEAFDRTFAITTILKVIAIVVSILGVASTLLAQVLDRRAEIMTLRTIGASVRRVIVIILLEALLIGLTGLVMGTLAGLVMSWVLTKVIMLESFGWTIGFSIPWLEVLQAGLIVVGFTVIASILPVREAVRAMQSSAPTSR